LASSSCIHVVPLRQKPLTNTTGLAAPKRPVIRSTARAARIDATRETLNACLFDAAGRGVPIVMAAFASLRVARLGLAKPNP
jgi:hypothetical protein